MSRIDVKDQVRLPLRRCFQLTVSGIRYRIFRSAITVVIVALAVAFLMMMLSASYVERKVGRDVRARTAGRRLLSEWVDRLSVPMSPAVLADRLAAAQAGGAAWHELRQWGGLDEAELARLAAVARKQAEYQRFFERLKPGDCNAITGPRSGDALFAYLAEPGRMDEFAAELAKMFPAGGVPVLPGIGSGSEVPVADFVRDFKAFVDDYAATAPIRQKILAGNATAVAGLSKDLGGRSVLDLLCKPDAPALDLLARHGFDLAGLKAAPATGAAPLEEVRREAVIALDAQRLVAMLRDERMRGVIASAAGTTVTDVTPRNVYAVGAGVSGARDLKREVTVTRAYFFTLAARLKVLEALAPLTAEQLAQLAASAGGASTSGPATTALPAVSAAQWADLAEDPVLRRALAERLNADVNKIQAQNLLDTVAKPDGAAWFLAQLTARRADIEQFVTRKKDTLLGELDLPAERIAEVASAQLAQMKLADVEAKLTPEGEDDILGFPRRTAWLIAISFLVCVVGVANAMLMSVTERFREIATMKCLGALDSFIMVIFVLESALQGLVGGVAGVALGLLLGVLRSAWSFGGLALGNLPPAPLAASAGACLAAGVLLAATAAIYPAWVAARLAPMEAMRIE